MFKIFICVCPIIFFAGTIMAAPIDIGSDSSRKSDSVSNKMMGSINNKYRSIEKGLAYSSVRSLKGLQKLETKLNKKLATKDSGAAARLFSTNEADYSRLINNVQNPGEGIAKSIKNYIPGLDSTQTAFKFLSNSSLSSSSVPTGKLQQFKQVSSQISRMQVQLQSATDIKQFIKERKQKLNEQLEKVGLGKELKKFNEQAYYYQQKVSEYKAMVSDPNIMEQKALGLLRNLPAFKDFMSKHGQLAQLFPSTGVSGVAQNLQGLQTRVSIQQQLTQQLGNGGGGNPQQYLQQQVQQARDQMDQLKNKINKAGGGSSDMEMPGFTPNEQKTKSFWKRIEYGLNIQSQKTTGLLPTTSDIALTAGYKLNDKSTIGIGAGYKMGWGKNISHIHFSSQGMSLRSYIDIKLKGSIWISGGYEGNYQQEFTRVEQLQNINAWQRSGLIGLTKKYKLGKKNGNLQLLWDFLSYEQIPKTQAVKFRIGYTL